jgi:hypothetical protein
MSIQVFECVGQLCAVSDHSVVAVFAHGNAFGRRASHVMPLAVSVEAAAMFDCALDPVVSFAHRVCACVYAFYYPPLLYINKRTQRNE